MTFPCSGIGFVGGHVDGAGEHITCGTVGIGVLSAQFESFMIVLLLDVSTHTTAPVLGYLEGRLHVAQGMGACVAHAGVGAFVGSG